MDFVKALIPGSILTFVVCAVMGAGHTKGGWLNIQQDMVHLEATGAISAYNFDQGVSTSTSETTSPRMISRTLPLNWLRTLMA